MSNNQSKKTRPIDFILKYAIQIVLVILIVFFAISSDIFATFDNLINVLRQVTVPGIIAIGMALVIITGGIDLSVGSVIALGGIIAGAMMKNGIDPFIAIFATLVAGTIVGVFNGFFINQLNMPPFVATLGSMTFIRGITYIITQGQPVYGFPDIFKFIGQGYIGPIPFPIILMAIVYVFGYIFVDKTKYGRYIYGIGGNEEATKLSGINVKKVKYTVYMMCGGLTALASIVLLSRVNSGQPAAGVGVELDVITAVILGGISITGGEGKISGVLIGVLILGVLTNGLQLLNVNVYVQQVIQGLVLLGAVSFDKFIQRRNARVA